MGKRGTRRHCARAAPSSTTSAASAASAVRHHAPAGPSGRATPIASATASAARSSAVARSTWRRIHAWRSAAYWRWRAEGSEITGTRVPDGFGCGPALEALLAQSEVHDVQSHAQRGFTLVGRIVMDFLVLEAIAQVAIVRIEYNQPSIVNNREGPRRAAVVLVDLRQTARHLVKLMKNRVRERQLDDRIVGEYALHLAPERRVDAEVVVHPQKSPARQIAAQVLDFAGRELHVAVSAREQERVLVQGGRCRFDHGLAIARDANRRALAQRTQQVHDRRAVLVPVAAAAVLETAHPEFAGPGRRRLGGRGARGREGENDGEGERAGDPRGRAGTARDGERTHDVG